MTADLKIHVPDNLIVRGRGLRLGGRGLKLGDMNVTLGGDVRVRKQPDERALVVGSVHTIRGFYEFQGRRFDVQRDGLVAFKGPDFTNPTLDLQAQRNISGVDAFVRIRGTAQRPELELSSRPPLDQADILSLIVFNRPINDLGAGEQDALAQQTAALVGGMVAAPLAEAVRDALGVDLFEISATGEEGRGASVTVGEQIGERVFVRVRQQFGSTEATALLLEYQIAEFLRLQTNVVEGAETNRAIGNRVDRGGIDLIFVVRY
jgi:translocation and assembly module TamB